MLRSIWLPGVHCILVLFFFYSINFCIGITDSNCNVYVTVTLEEEVTTTPGETLLKRTVFMTTKEALVVAIALEAVMGLKTGSQVEDLEIQAGQAVGDSETEEVEASETEEVDGNLEEVLVVGIEIMC